MAWTFDNASSMTETDADGVVTLSHNVGTLTNGIMFIMVGWSLPAVTLNSLTVGGVAATHVNTKVGSSRVSSLWYFIAPSSGAQDVVATFSATSSRTVLGAATYSGGNAVQTPAIADAVGSDGAPSVTVTTAAGELVVDSWCMTFTAGNTITVGANQTERVKTSGGATIAGMSVQDGADGGTMTQTGSDNTKFWASVAGSFQPAAAPTATARTSVVIVG